MDWAIKLLKSLAETMFYGKIILSFENGKIAHVEKRSSHKPPQ